MRATRKSAGDRVERQRRLTYAGRPRVEGFTLIEMLLAVTLLTLMAVALWSVFRISLTSWTRGMEYADSNQRHRGTMDMVRKQLASTYGALAPIDLQAGGAIYPIFTGARESIHFISLSSLRFVDNPGLTRVSYEVVREERGTFALVQREQQYLGMQPGRESFMDRVDETTFPIFQNLTTFYFEYLDPGTQERPSRWVASWDAREYVALPRAVSMAMISVDPKGRNISRHIVIPIHAKPYDPRLNFVNPLDSRPRRLSEDDPRSR